MKNQLAFPEHGGVILPEDAKLAGKRTFNHKGSSYTIKVYTVKRGPFSESSYHYLKNDDEVTSGSFQARTVEQSFQAAIKSIKEAHIQHAKQNKMARMSEAQKSRFFAAEKMKKSVKFFTAMMNGDADAGKKLATAEHFAEENGWRVEWVPDSEPYEMGDAETEAPSEVFVAVLRNADNAVLASLGGIVDPNDKYVRLVNAELAQEALG
jgi:hypothetical protein